MEWIRKFKVIMPILAVILSAACIGNALTDYEAPVYAAEPVQEEAAAADSADKVAKKLAQKVLPQRKSSEAKAKGSKSVAAAKDPGKYRDGTYTGISMGYGGPITVKVTILKGKMDSIDIVKTSDDQAYLKKAEAVISRILKSQNTNVDTVSGATYSSAGIIKAVRNALAKAAVKDSGKTEESGNSGASAAGEEKQEAQDASGQDTAAASAKVTKNGDDYTVTVPCSPDSKKQFKAYKMTVKTRITGGSIKSVEIVKTTGTKNDGLYWGMACDEISDGLPVSSAGKISAVSGATCSAKAIKEACRLALNEAKKYESTDEDPDPGENGGGNDSDPKEPQPEQPSEPSGPPEQSDPTDPAEPSEPDGESGQMYQDGTYTVSVTCRWQESCCFDDDWSDYPLKVTAVIAGGKITEISSALQTRGAGSSTNKVYINKAKKGINGQLPAAGADGIDAVSGATCSSKAIKEACRLVLEQAKAAKETKQ